MRLADQTIPHTSTHAPAKTLTTELAELLDRHSVESESDTPDFVLAQYLMTCMEAFNTATRRRDIYFGHRLPSAND